MEETACNFFILRGHNVKKSLKSLSLWTAPISAVGLGPSCLHLYPSHPTVDHNHCCHSCPLTAPAFVYLITPSFHFLAFVVMALSCLLLSTYKATDCLVFCLALSELVFVSFNVFLYSTKFCLFWSTMCQCKLYFESLVMKCAFTKCSSPCLQFHLHRDTYSSFTVI